MGKKTSFTKTDGGPDTACGLWLSTSASADRSPHLERKELNSERVKVPLLMSYAIGEPEASGLESKSPAARPGPG